MVTSKTRPCIQIIVQIKRLFIIINHCPTKSTSMPLKLAANLSMMFAEVPTLAERYECAKDAGFKYVTATFPYAEDAGALAKARRKAGLEQVLINGWPGICIVFFFRGQKFSVFPGVSCRINFVVTVFRSFLFKVFFSVFVNSFYQMLFIENPYHSYILFSKMIFSYVN